MQSIQNIDVINEPSPEEFYNEYWSKQRPVIINGIASKWPAAALWTPEYFKEKYANAAVRYERGKSDEVVKDPVRFLQNDQVFVNTTLKEYIDLIEGPREPGRTNYLAEFAIFDVIPDLLKDIDLLSKYMVMPSWYPQKLKKYLTLKPRFWLGPKDSLSSCHFDMPHNIFVQLYGTKQWTLISPDQSKNLYFPCDDLVSEFLHWSPVDIEEPDLNRFPLFKNVKPIQFTVKPGQMLFVPSSWWHHVRSLDTSISLNFFWFDIARNLVSLRKYLYYRGKKMLLNKLGLKKEKDISRVKAY